MKVQTYLKKFSILALLAGLISFQTGCHFYSDTPPPPPPPPCWGHNGINGDAFLAFDYSAIKPAYVWGNNLSIPTHFNYGYNYLSSPGHFALYYEGSFMDGCCMVDYHWDVNYDIWINPGFNGACYENGANGADSFLRIFMDPYEPGFERINKQGGPEVNILEKSGDKIVVEMKNEHFIMKAEYTKFHESRRAELEALKTN